MTTAPMPGDLTRRLHDDVGEFAAFIGESLTCQQRTALGLEKRETVICAPRQSGKSRSLSVLALWWAFRRRDQFVLIVSASEAAARDLLGKVRALAAAGPLGGSVLDESKSEIVLANGSRIRSVPCSQLAIRGLTVDLLIVDEAAQVPDEIHVAADPTQNARPEGRKVLASTPFGMERRFAESYRRGLADNPFTDTFQWSLEQCPWISPAVIEDARQRLPSWQFRQEYLGEFAAGGGGYFDADDLARAVAPYDLTPPDQANGGTVVAGLDWGRANDSHAIALLGVLDDYGVNGRPVLFVPWCETSQRRYAEQEDVVAALAKGGPARRRAWLGGPTQGRRINAGASGYHVARFYSERNGVGFMATENLQARLGLVVEGINTTAATKEANFSTLLSMLSSGQLVLPNHPTLLRELNSLTAEPMPSGHVRIAAAGAGHDDLAMALSFTASAITEDAMVGRASHPSGRTAADLEFHQTPSGVLVPTTPRPRIGGLGAGRYYARAE